MGPHTVDTIKKNEKNSWSDEPGLIFFFLIFFLMFSITF